MKPLTFGNALLLIAAVLATVMFVLLLFTDSGISSDTVSAILFGDLALAFFGHIIA